MSFNNIIGNEGVKHILNKSLMNSTVLHSYMFIGEEGIGKRLIAEQFAKMILCDDFNGVECDKCKSCVEFNGGSNPDYNVLEPEGRVLKIEQIREMQNKIYEKPVNSDRKVYIINDADLMTKEAQNCLLKTLEEPPEYIVIILVVSNENRVLTTIKSRCMKVYFEKVSNDEVRKYLIEKCDVQNPNDNIITMCNGSIGKCKMIKERLDDYDQLDCIFKNINSSVTSLINSAEILYKNKDNINDYLEYINVILYKKAKEEYNSNKYINSIKVVEKTKQRLLSNANYDMCIDYLLFNIWEEVNEKNSRG